MAAPKLYYESPANRSKLLLLSLRTNPKHADGVLVAEGHEFPVHIGFITALSPFFSVAFGGSFLEATSKRCTLEDAPKAAVAVIIDYLYCVEFDFDPAKETQLVLDVWMLAHRYQIDDLKLLIAQVAVEFLRPETCIAILDHAKTYGSEGHVTGTLCYIARNLRECYTKCNAFRQLELDDLRQVLSSCNLIGNEYDKFRVVIAWGTDGYSVRRCGVDDLLSNVQFERFESSQLVDILHKFKLPRAALTQAVKQLAESREVCGECSPNGTAKFKLNVRKITSVGTRGYRPRTELHIVPGAKCTFILNHWNLSAEIRGDNANTTFKLIVSFKNRLKHTGTDDKLWLSDEISHYRFLVQSGYGGNSSTNSFEPDKCELEFILNKNMLILNASNVCHLSLTLSCHKLSNPDQSETRNEAEDKQGETGHWDLQFRRKGFNTPNPHPFGPSLYSSSHVQAHDCGYYTD